MPSITALCEFNGFITSVLERFDCSLLLSFPICSSLIFPCFHFQLRAPSGPRPHPNLLLSYQLCYLGLPYLELCKISSNPSPFFSILVSFDATTSFFLQQCPPFGRIFDHTPCILDEWSLLWQHNSQCAHEVILSLGDFFCSQQTNRLLYSRRVLSSTFPCGLVLQVLNWPCCPPPPQKKENMPLYVHW